MLHRFGAGKIAVIGPPLTHSVSAKVIGPALRERIPSVGLWEGVEEREGMKRTGSGYERTAWIGRSH